MAQTLKNLSAMQETQVRSLSGEDPLEKEMATHSSVLAWRIPWSEKPGGLQSMGSHRVGHDWSDLAAAAAVVNIGVNVAFWIRVFVFSGCMLRSGIAGSYGNLVSYGTSMLFSVVTAPIYILTKSVGVFPFLHILSSIYYLLYLSLFALERAYSRMHRDK